MRIQRNQKQVETRYYLSTLDVRIAHIGLTYKQSDQTDASKERGPVSGFSVICTHKALLK